MSGFLINPYIVVDPGSAPPSPDPDPAPEPDPILRAVATNGNVLPYQAPSSTTRHRNFRKKQWLAANSDWDDLEIDWPNFVATATNELSANYRHLVIRAGVKWNGTYYQVQKDGASEWIVPPGEVVRTQVTGAPTMTGDTEIEFCYRTSLPLGYTGKTVAFQVGEVVTGAGGASGTVQVIVEADSTTGRLVLFSESGTFVNGEALAGNLGGAATVQFQSASVLQTVGTQAVWGEGFKSSQNASIDWTMSDPAEPAVASVGSYDPSGNNIATVSLDSGGSTGWLASDGNPTMYAWEVMADGQLAVVTLGGASIVSGGVVPGAVSNGAPPSGMTWTSPNVTIAGGTSFGATTSIYAPCLVTGIPQANVKTLLLNGDSITRGFWSTDTLGDRKHNYGLYERAVANRVGVVNMSTPGTKLGNQIQYVSLFPLSFGAYMGTCTHALTALGTNDIEGGAGYGSVSAWSNYLVDHIRSFGTLVARACVIPRGKPMTITNITAANPAVVTCDNALVNGEQVKITGVLGTMGTSLLNGNTYTVANATATTFELAGVDTSALAYDRVNGDGSTTPGGGSAYNFTNAATQLPATGFGEGGIADQFNDAIIAGTLDSDWNYVNFFPYFEDDSNAWQWRKDDQTGDLVHPNVKALSLAAVDATNAAFFDVLE